MAFRGFDIDVFPGFDVMRDVKPFFDLVAYYLRAPSHDDQSWQGKRSGLAQLGYGLAPVFVGQEVIGPGSHVLTADQGLLDGEAAALAMAAEGFAPGSKVFLDLENGPPFGAQQLGYVGAMLAACSAGGMVGGVYASHALAPALLAAFPFLADDGRLWLFRVPTVSRTTAAAPFPAPNPILSGASAAGLWQYRQNVEVTLAGHTMVVDLDTATLADPSVPPPGWTRPT